MPPAIRRGRTVPLTGLPPAITTSARSPIADPAAPGDQSAGLVPAAA